MTTPYPSGRAEFCTREKCVSCESSDLETLDRGRFDQGPHLADYSRSPWGDEGLPFLKKCEWELVRCKQCAQVFHKRVLTPQWEEVRFTKWLTKEAITRFETERGLLSQGALLDQAQREVGWVLSMEKLTRELRAGGSMRLLDFGCGWGRVVAFASLFGCAAFGIDRSLARQGGASGIGEIFESLDAFVSSQAEPVHVVSLFQVLEHLHQPIEVLRALHEILAPGGFLVIEVPDGSGFLRINEPNTLGVADGLDHVNAFDPHTLSRIAENAGFKKFNSQPTPQVTADFHRVVKREALRALRRFLPATVSQIFRKARD